MQLPKKLEIDDRVCPVSEQEFSRLRRSNPAEAAVVASTLPENQRAQLAAFCYKRMHLSHLAIMIAASCERQTLVSAMGRAGEMLFEQSRDPEKAISELRQASGLAARNGISLATFGRKRQSNPDETDDTIVRLHG